MRLHTQMLEDMRGARSVHATLDLHGPIAWPEGSVARWSNAAKSLPVGPPLQSPGGANRPLASLEVIAPDDLADEQIESLLGELRESVVSSGPSFVEQGGGSVSLQIAERAAAERDGILGELQEATLVRLRRRKRRTTLRVLRLELTDFRGVAQLTLALSSNATSALVGVNGSGKTTLLDAMVLLLAHLEAGLRGSGERPRDLTDDDIMNGRVATRISTTVQIGDNPITWSLSRERGGDVPPAQEREGLFSLDEEIAHIRSELARGDVSLPVAVHYAVNRAVLDIPLRIRTTHLFEPIEAYDGALARGDSNFRLFFEWFRNREDLENETRISRSEYRDPQLEAVRRAIMSLLPGVSGLRVQRSPLRMVVTKGEWSLYAEQLSDGEKCLLATAGDLARRLAMANPFADDPLQGGGAVLIDEIELHLHPGWQWRIVPALERTFPNCQFIVSTHSPAVLGYVDHDSAFILQPDSTGVRVVRPDVSRGLEVNRIFEDLLGVPARLEEVQSQLDEMFRRMDAGDTAGARSLHTELTTTLRSDDPALVKAEVLLRRRELARR